MWFFFLLTSPSSTASCLANLEIGGELPNQAICFCVYSSSRFHSVLYTYIFIRCLSDFSSSLRSFSMAVLCLTQALTLAMNIAIALCSHMRCLFLSRIYQSFLAYTGLPHTTMVIIVAGFFLFLWDSFTSFYILTGNRNSSRILNCQIMEDGERTVFSIPLLFQASGIRDSSCLSSINTEDNLPHSGHDSRVSV